MDVPLAMKFYDQSTTIDSTNVLSATPLYNFTRDTGYITITDTSVDTKTVTFAVKGLPVGTFNVTLVSPHTLINLRNGVAVVQEGASIDMGTLIEGNPDDRCPDSGCRFQYAD